MRYWLSYGSKKIVICVLCVLCCQCILLAQIKIEKEVSISEKEAPESAVDYIGNQAFQKKIKWYREFSQLGISYEAKTCFKKQKYSVEFSEEGELLDIEITIPYKNIPKKMRSGLEINLKKKFKRFKIKKVQEQFAGPNISIQEIEVLRTKPFLYEIELKGKTESHKGYFEILVDQAGTILRSAEIMDRGFDNLEF